MDSPFDPAPPRRDFLSGSASIVAIAAALPGVADARPPRRRVSRKQPPAEAENVTITFTVNGQRQTVTLDSRVTLLDALRDHLHLTGTKKGCDHGQCGACTVIADGRRINSCLTLAAMHDGAEITTIEGLGTPEHLSPLQAAFIEHDGFQCGYCTPGQICSATAMLDEIRKGYPSYVSASLTDPPRLGDDEIRERMSGNLCRCAAYPNIVAAIREAMT
jgi:xanthine dehydrogenase YagT iron-sulfur-binding subunit